MAHESLDFIFCLEPSFGFGSIHNKENTQVYYGNADMSTPNTHDCMYYLQEKVLFLDLSVICQKKLSFKKRKLKNLQN